MSLEESLLVNATTDGASESGSAGHDSEDEALEVVGSSETWRAMKEVYQSSLPQILVILCRLLISTTDTAVVGHISTESLAAAAFAGMWIQITGQLIWGSLDGLIALTSQSVGAQNFHLAFVWLEISLINGIIMSIPVLISWMCLGSLLQYVSLPVEEGVDRDEVIDLAAQFGQLSSLWLVQDAMSSCFCQWLNGLNVVRATIPVHVFFVFFNLVSNVVLVHGIGSWDGLGFKGSPIATAVTTTARLVALVVYMRDKLPKGVKMEFSRGDITKSRIQTFLSQAVANALVAILENTQFLVLTLMIGSYSEKQLSAHSIMMQMFDLLSCGMYGLVEGGSQTIARALGAGNVDLARNLGKTLLSCMFIMGLAVTLIFLTTRSVVGKVFSEDDKVIDYASNLAILSGFAYLLLALTFANFAIIQGQARPNKAVLSMFLGTWVVGMPSAWLISKHYHHEDNDAEYMGAWEGSIIGYTVMTLMMMKIVYDSDWEELSRQARTRAEVENTPELTRRSSSFLINARFSTVTPPPRSLSYSGSDLAEEPL